MIDAPVNNKWFIKGDRLRKGKKELILECFNFGGKLEKKEKKPLIIKEEM